MNNSLPTARDKVLFTPGPLTTSLTVKQAMLRDAGSWHFEFNVKVKEIRQRILKLAGVTSEKGYECILLQGSGTFGVESVFSTSVPEGGKVLVLSNGAYGERMVAMLKCLRIENTVYRTGENEPPDPAHVASLLEKDTDITHVAVVHCETTTGIVNPIASIGKTVKAAQRHYIVDAMSSLGGMPIDFEDACIDFLVSSANKCIEGVPGFSFVIAKRDPLFANESTTRSLSLDLAAQLRGFEKNGQFRYSPPTHSLLAFEQALNELDTEGGVEGRAARYKRNHEVLMNGMESLGFKSYLDAKFQSYLITSFHFPEDSKFTFDAFYRKLSDRGMIIYPGKISQVDLFRIGSIGRIFECDVLALVGSIQGALTDMGVSMR
ncbi:MAG TPA: 2-aminoethylphosphonate--pyruvate transaminase [Verrucomicrobiales bacterium]|nr:2-aminoethylphosphonate--pyruvate transaminase [Pedosphaera sp.]MBL6843257.1 2-aminoethylphosphonate--pyruvate transaminase [Verrucomicrobiae bacterium]RZO68075.1 MAG: 2-aminoethylphosphonate--pyruvate transaminase [Limisphaerales bacterium]HAO67294.1 2-aminoethylphosphonate--pyruvate transaminase [Verrucomicrobiales bacterium]HAQ98560.1 2-aminoethylphosphonate--pyruvate transaminase [Verrucomicrobiales bacterium]|tara:strand:- start:1271 stop:2401 length:1131 start_codon:yes stop_codon:yes gene_type:complete